MMIIGLVLAVVGCLLFIMAIFACGPYAATTGLAIVGTVIGIVGVTFFGLGYFG